MIQKDYNDFYLRTTWIDRLIYTICILLMFKNPELFTDIKNYLNRRILLNLISTDLNHLVFTENFKNILTFNFDGYTIDYNCKTNSVTLLLGNIMFIQGHDYGDTKIVKQIIEILNKKYHEHQASIMQKVNYQEEG